MTQSPLTQQVTRSEQVLFTDLAGESVLLNIDSEQYFGLDDVGTRMFSLLTENRSIQETYDTLLEEYEVEPEQLRADLLNLVNQLLENGLLEVIASEN